MITKPHYKFIMDITQIIYRNIQILLFSKPYPSIPFPVSKFLKLYARDWMQSLETFGGGMSRVLRSVGAFSGRIGLPPAVMGWAASCDDGP